MSIGLRRRSISHNSEMLRRRRRPHFANGCEQEWAPGLPLGSQYGGKWDRNVFYKRIQAVRDVYIKKYIHHYRAES